MEQHVVRKRIVRSLSQYVAAFVAILLALNLSLIYYVNRSYRTELTTMHRHGLAQSLEQIDKYMLQAQSVLHSVRHQETLSRLLENRRMSNAERIPLLRYEILPYFDSILAWTAYVHRVRLLHTDQDLPNLYDSIVYSNAIAVAGYAAFLSSLQASPSASFYIEHLPRGISYFPSLASDNAQYTINLYLPIHLRNTLHVAALVQVSIDAEALLRQALDTQAPAYLLGPGNALLWSNGLLSAEDCLSLSAQPSDLVHTDGGGRFLVLSQYSETMQATIYRVIPLDFFADGSALTALLAASILLLLALMALLTLRLYRPFTRQLQTLVESMRRFRAVDDYTLRVPVTGENELTLVSLTFNDMLANTEALMQRIVASGKAEKQAVYAALSNQIRPHFLNNALDRVRMAAQTHGVLDVAEPLERIMRYLRYNLGNQHMAVTLSEELENVSDYISMFKLSRGEPIELCLNVLEGARGNLHAYFLPKFTLLPIVENCIHHGFSQAKPAMRIIITVCLAQDLLTIQVEDNGSGMERARLASLQGHLAQGMRTALSGGGSGIGLSLVQERLTLYYGKDIPFTVESYPDTGTLVTFSVPLLQNKELTS